jgi:hypothetical protein
MEKRSTFTVSFADSVFAVARRQAAEFRNTKTVLPPT